jgi:hypothetical protein
MSVGWAAPYRYALVSGRVRGRGFQQTSFPQAEKWLIAQVTPGRRAVHPQLRYGRSVRRQVGRAQLLLEQCRVGQYDAGWHLTDACHNKGGLVHVALVTALVGDNGVRGNASQCPARQWLE